MTSVVEAALAALYQALEKWYRSSHGRGLHQLTLPFHSCADTRTTPPVREQSDTYLYTLAKYCPNIEYLDGWKVTFYDSFRLECADMLLCTVAAWEAFCKSCAHIREPNWFTVPLDDDYLDAFSKYEKCQLTSMIAASWSECDNAIAYWLDGEFHRPRGFQLTPMPLATMLQACPKLQRLDVLFSTESEDPSRLVHAVGDTFLVHLAQSCPELEELVIDYIDVPGTSPVLETITDVGLLALATHRSLQSLVLLSNRASAHGIVALIANFSSPSQYRRDVCIDVGCSEGPTQINFYGVLLAVLAELLDLPRAALTGRRFKLELNRCSWSEFADQTSTRSDLVAAQQRFGVQHPDVALVFQLEDLSCSEHTPANLLQVDRVWFVSQRV